MLPDEPDVPAPPFERPRPPVERLVVERVDRPVPVPADLRALVFLAVPAELDLAARDLALVPLLLLRLAAVPLLLVAREVPAPVERDFAAPDELDAPLLLSSSTHLPLITRWAASATASAIREPRRVALDIAVVAALDAASAASSPASRILRRADGLALIAAAAAASPAASISRLIAAFAILSTVLSPEPDDAPEPDFFADDFEELFLVVDFAIADLLYVRKDTSDA